MDKEQEIIERIQKLSNDYIEIDYDVRQKIKEFANDWPCQLYGIVGDYQQSGGWDSQYREGSWSVLHGLYKSEEEALKIKQSEGYKDNSTPGENGGTGSNTPSSSENYKIIKILIIKGKWAVIEDHGDYDGSFKESVFIDICDTQEDGLNTVSKEKSVGISQYWDYGQYPSGDVFMYRILRYCVEQIISEDFMKGEHGRNYVDTTGHKHVWVTCSK